MKFDAQTLGDALVVFGALDDGEGVSKAVAVFLEGGYNGVRDMTASLIQRDPITFAELMTLPVPDNNGVGRGVFLTVLLSIGYQLGRQAEQEHQLRVMNGEVPA